MVNQPDPNFQASSEIARLEKRRVSTRWHGTRGFLGGALPTLPLGVVGGVLLGGVAAIASPLVLAGGIGLAGMGLIAGTTVAVGAALGGTKGAYDGIRDAKLTNFEINHAINAISANAQRGVSTSLTPHEQRSVSHPVADRFIDTGQRSLPRNWVDGIRTARAARREAISTVDRY